MRGIVDSAHAFPFIYAQEEAMKFLSILLILAAAALAGCGSVANNTTNNANIRGTNTNTGYVTNINANTMPTMPANVTNTTPGNMSGNSNMNMNRNMNMNTMNRNMNR